MRAFVAATLVVSVVAAAPATAATVSRDGSTVRYVADDPSVHTAVVSDTAAEIQIGQVRGSTLEAGPGCAMTATSRGTTPVVVCPRDGVTQIAAQFGSGDDSLSVALTPSAPALTMSGGAGVDVVNYIRGGPVSVTLDGASNDGSPGRGDNIGPDVENVGGTDGNDGITGSDAANDLAGNSGRDALTGGGGDDFFEAREFVDCGEGDACPDPQADTISCGPGRDLVDGDHTDLVADDCELVVRSNSIGLTSGADTFAGFRPNLTIIGRAGNDRISGMGNDQLEGNSGDDLLRAGPFGQNSVRGGSGDDVLVGHSGDEYMAGGYGRDRINGRGDKDRIDGGAGRDLLSGGAGNDRIVSRERGDERDRVSCDSGRDIVIADRNDVVSRSCERVIRG